MDIYYSKKFIVATLDLRPNCVILSKQEKKKVKYIIKLYIYFHLSAKLSFDDLISDPLVFLVILHLCKP